MDYETDFKIAKKSVKHDITEGIITLPLIYTLYKKPELKELIKSQNLPQEELRSVISDVLSLGGIKMTHDVSEKYYYKAKKLLERIQYERKRALFSDILEKINERKY
jgi:heptaprenyl diphosphate synthase